HRLFREALERAVVEDVAVLEDLDKGRALVLRHSLQGGLEVLRVDIERAGNQGRLGCQGEANRIDGLLDRAHRARFRLLSHLARGRVLPLGQAINAVVEEEDLQIDVPTKGVKQMVSTDGEAISIPRHHPDLKVGANRLETCGKGWSPPVNAVEAV